MSQTISEQLAYLARHGHLLGALEQLNQVAGCRFTAIFRFDGGDLRNLILVDRENMLKTVMDTIPVTDSYCMFVQQSGDAFLVEDSLIDARVVEHPKRPVVRTYLGYPVVTSSGKLFGTLCHFDFDRVEVSALARSLSLEFIAGLDPLAIEEAALRDVEKRFESLQLMTDLIVNSSKTTQEALEAFREFAAPLNSESVGRLSSAASFEIQLKLDALEESVIKKADQRNRSAACVVGAEVRSGMISGAMTDPATKGS